MNNSIRLRLATLDDARRLWEWRNEPATRAASFNTAVIEYTDHCRWLEQKISDRNVRFLIAVDSDQNDIGYARLNVIEESAEISLSIDKNHRGKGIGSAFIRAVTDFALDNLKVRRVVARMKTENKVSVAAFLRAGFSIVGRGEIVGAHLTEMVCERKQ